MRKQILLTALGLMLGLVPPAQATKVVKAQVWGGADDEAYFFINDSYVAGLHWRDDTVETAKIAPELFQASNILACYDLDEADGDGQFLGYFITITLDNGKTINLTSDEEKAGHRFLEKRGIQGVSGVTAESIIQYGDWTKYGFDDSGWGTELFVVNRPANQMKRPINPATGLSVDVLSTNGEGRSTYGMSGSYVFYRRKFNLWPTETPTSPPTAVPTLTPIPPTETMTATAFPTPKPKATALPTSTPVSTSTPIPTSTPLPFVPTGTLVPTLTAVPTITPLPTETPVPTSTPAPVKPTATFTPRPTKPPTKTFTAVLETATSPTLTPRPVMILEDDGEDVVATATLTPGVPK